ncbi:hypothetical protein OIY81_2561 [Cryptosporidium canis]|uniref:Sulfhydryl oxidase n=1 Tax=Cryptosporidium canis TaxID=195482 RepID=A0ABQ8P4X4_9CRYT|nr:hypothetical protein OJ252_2545 [Cryptosporidium canis]KAJ1608756.1 hypothetical protein OIY81_2561 [Cryptosporidium canis]
MFLFGRRLGERCVEESCKDGHWGQVLTVAFQTSSRSGADVEGGEGVPPPNIREIGAATWLYLHSMANRFPESPSSHDQERYRNWIQDLSDLYPCKVCRGGMKRILKAAPPSLNDRKDFVLWLCQFHNKVNRELGARTYKCSYQDLLRRFSH